MKILLAVLVLTFIGCASPKPYQPTAADVEMEQRIKQEIDLKDNLTTDKLKIGMTSDQVLEVWPRPNKANHTVNTRGTRDQWVYNRGRDRIYLYFQDGVLTGWQE